MTVEQWLTCANRMCNQYFPNNCKECPAGSNIGKGCWHSRTPDIELCKQIVDDWVRLQYPTRASEFIKQYPDVTMLAPGYPSIDPCIIEHSKKTELCMKYTTCGECNRGYWLEPQF